MKHFKLIKIISLCMIIAYGVWLYADSHLDRSFSLCGRVESSFGIDSMGKAVAIQSDGKIVVAGYSDMKGQNTFAVARYESDGTLDKSFAHDGIALTMFGASEKMSGAQAILIQPDGKIIAAGFTNALKSTFRWCLARYNSDGSLDESFFGGRGIIPGTVINTFGGVDDASQVYALALQSDGKIIAAGISVMGDNVVFAVARYMNNGSLDTTFNKDTQGSIPGGIRTDFGSSDIKDDRAYAVAVQPDGKIVVGGSSWVSGVKTFAMARYLSDGSLDSSFYNAGFSKIHGTVIASFAGGETNAAIKALIIQADSTIIAAGYSNCAHMPADKGRFALARFLPCGELDSSFGGNGISVVPGTVITSFGNKEQASQINSMVMQADGKVIAGGFTTCDKNTCFALARYNVNGTLDFILNGDDSVAGTMRTAFPGSTQDEIYSIALQPDGSVVAVGKTASALRPHIALARYSCLDNVLLAPVFEYPQDGDRIVNGSAITVKGKAQHPALVQIYLDNTTIHSFYTKTADWSVTLPPLASGQYTLRAHQLYPAGNLCMSSEQQIFTVDQHPRAVDQQFVTAQEKTFIGQLGVSGASGKYYYNIIANSNGHVRINDDSFVFVPTINEGLGSFDFEAIDSETGCTAKARVQIVIHPLPIVHNVYYQGCQDKIFEGNLSNYVTTGMPPYSFFLTNSNDDCMLALHEDGSFVFTPAPEFVGLQEFVYYAMDQRSNKSKPGHITIEIFESPFAQNGNFRVCQDTQCAGSVALLTSKGTPPYQYKLVSDSVHQGEIELNNDGSFIFTPPTGFIGQGSFEYQVTDAHEYSAQARVVIEVVEKPEVQSATVTLIEDSVYIGNLASLVSKGQTPYIFDLIKTANNGVVTFLENGGFHYVPQSGFSGTDSFVYQIQDAHNCLSNLAEVIVIVQPKPQVATVNVETNQGIPLITSVQGGVQKGNPPFVYTLLNGEEHSETHLSQDGILTYTPTNDFSGSKVLEYQVVDSLGLTSNVGTIDIHVHPRPIVTQEVITICQDTPLSGTLASLVSGGLEPYTFELSGQPVNSTVDINTDGSYLFAPWVGFNGVASFGYTVTDAHQSVSKEGRVEVMVLEKLAFTNPIIQVAQDGILEGNLQEYVTAGIERAMVFNKISEDFGSLQLQENGLFSFIPTAGFTGFAGFEVEIRDIYNFVTRGTVTIMVKPKPIVTDYHASVCQDNLLQGSLLEMVSNGTSPYIFNQAAEPVNAIVQIDADGSFKLTPLREGPQATFNYMATDVHGYTSNIATGFITIHPAPQVVGDIYTMKVNSVLKGDLSSSVVGGTSSYQFASVDIAQNGNVVIDKDGSFVFIPSANFIGNAQFNYQVTDANGCKTIATAVINVLSVEEYMKVRQRKQKEKLKKYHAYRRSRTI